MTKKFYDTNVFLDCPSVLDDLTDVVVPSTVIDELENIKTNVHKDGEVKFKARQAVRAIRQAMKEDKLSIAFPQNGVLAEFDRVIGLDKLKALHLNDSKNPFASHKDRHELLGEGNLGLDAFRRIVNHPYLKTLPMILETPNELPGYAREIALLREMEI